MDWIPGLNRVRVSFPRAPFPFFLAFISFGYFIFVWSDEEWCRREGDDFIWLTAAPFVVNLIKFYLN